MDGYLTTNEIALRLNVKVETVRRWINQGRLPGLSLGRAGYRVRQEDFDCFVAQRHPASDFSQLASSTSHTEASENARMEAIATLILERTTDGILLFSLEGQCQYVNEAAAQLLGVPADQIPGKTLAQILPDQSIDLKKNVSRASSDFYSTAMDRWFQLRTFAALQGWCLSFLDITERKQLEAQLREREQQFSTLVEHMPDIVLRLDRDLRHLYVSPTIEHITGYPPEAWLGKTAREMGLPAEECDRFEACCQEALKTGQEQQIEIFYLERWQRSRVLPEYDPTGVVKAFMCITEEITGRKRRELNIAFLSRLEKDFSLGLCPDELLKIVGEKIIYYLGLSRISFSQINDEIGEVIGLYDSGDQGLQRFGGSEQLFNYLSKDFLLEMQDGAVIAIDDIVSDPRTVAYVEAYKPYQVRAQMLAPHVSNGRVNFMIALQRDKPYQWRADEVNLARELGARIYPQLERARVEEDLRESRAEIEKQWRFFDAVLANVSSPVFAWNRQEQFVYVNRTLERLWGRDQSDVIGKTLVDLEDLGYTPEITTMLTKQIQQVFQTGADVNGEVAYTSPAGVLGYFEYTYSPVTSVDGTVELVVGVSQNVTDRKQMEEHFRSIANSMPQLLWSARADGAIDFFNERMHEYAPMTRNEEGIYQWQMLVHPDDREAVIHVWERAIRTEKVFEHEHRLQMRDGTYCWHLVRGVPIYDVNSSLLRWYGTKTDIEQLKQLERQRSEFIGLVSHELKTPVTSAKAFTEVLESRFRKAGDEKSAILLHKMHAQMDKLTHLISDLLDVTRFESGKLLFNENFFVFDDLVNDIIEEVQRTTTHKIVKQGEAPTVVYGDRERIGQVISNLLTNAIKYSPNATQVVVISSATEQEVCLCVQDFGIGIAQDKLPHVFERFFREAGLREDTFAGLGLGLYIASEIIHRQRGHMWVSSEKGHGSTFCFTLPLPQSRDRSLNEQPISEKGETHE